MLYHLGMSHFIIIMTSVLLESVFGLNEGPGVKFPFGGIYLSGQRNLVGLIETCPYAEI